MQIVLQEVEITVLGLKTLCYNELLLLLSLWFKQPT